ncbi:MAG: FMN-binding protein [Lachnospiraceae bacterium]|nr:FMN-binding protein [Lachnospiraceae bacterium]
MGKEIVSRTTFVKGVTACVVVAASLGIIQIGEYAVSSSEETATTTSATTGSASYTPGTYTATSAGISSDVSVTCTFDESSITAIEIDVSGETADIGAAIGDEMIEQFMAAQSSSVDGVSGATITSDALKAALEDCIAQATGGSSDEGEEAITEESEETEAGETESDEAAETETEGLTEADENAAEDSAKAETDEAAEADSAEAETDEAAEADSEDAAGADTGSTGSGVSYTPGTYTATAAGISSDVTVTITVDETNILSISCDVSGETESIGGVIGPEMIDQILAAQSADVDGVSGATITSDAVKAATADALSQAASDLSDPSEEDTDETEIAEADTEEAEAETEMAEADTEDAEVETEIAETDTEDAEVESDVAAVETEAETEADTDAVETEITTEAADTEEETEANTEAETEASEDTSEAADVGSGAYTPGIYSASASGISSDVTVTIIVDEDSILSVGYDLSGETDGIGADIGPEISEQILAAQSADVDGVSGATVTSDAVKAAIADCIAQAQAGTSAESGESTAETEDAAEPESETDAEAESEAESETDAEAETETESETEAEADEPETELTSTDEIETEYAASYVAGTYTATAEGYSTEITVTMTFDETSILEMDVDTSGETSTYALIDEDVIARILAAQSVEVDGISSATVTTDAILEAAADCIAQAQSDSTVTIIGGADDATEIFLAGKEEDEAESEEETDGTASSGEAAAAAYIPGTYTATAEGISSTITVSVTFDENRMYRIDYDLSGETEDIGAAIGPELTSRILDAQSTDVDGVSGATVTSDAVKSAVEDCITQALSDAE